MGRPRYTPEQLEAIKREIISEVRALSQNGIAPARADMGDALYQRAIWAFDKRITNLWVAAGLRARQYRGRPRWRPPAGPKNYRRGDLRRALGAYDGLDEAEERGA